MFMKWHELGVALALAVALLDLEIRSSNPVHHLHLVSLSINHTSVSVYSNESSKLGHIPTTYDTLLLWQIG